MSMTDRGERLKPHDYLESDESGLCRRCGFAVATHDADLSLARVAEYDEYDVELKMQEQFLELLEEKVARVRTVAGSKKYGLPIGAPITADAIARAAKTKPAQLSSKPRPGPGQGPRGREVDDDAAVTAANAAKRQAAKTERTRVASGKVDDDIAKRQKLAKLNQRRRKQGKPGLISLPDEPAKKPRKKPAARPTGNPPIGAGTITTKQREARGDGDTPMPAGKYAEGDPRNDPEYEAYADQALQRIQAALDAGLDTESLNTVVLDGAAGGGRAYTPKRSREHVRILDAIMEAAADVPADRQAVMMGGLPGAGKALALDTPIPTPTGWTTMGELTVGDLVLDDRGRPTKVVNATGVMHDHAVYEVEFSDGSVIVADADHQWFTTSRSDRLSCRPGAVRTTVELGDSVTSPYRNDEGRKNHAVAVAAPLDLPDADLPVEPYLLGAWLGDGSKDGVRIAVGNEDHDSLVRALLERGHETKTYRFASATHPVVGVNIGRQGRRNVTLDAMRSLGVVGAKHVPQIYLRSSQFQRLELLRGLMDTDGSIGKTGHCEFANTNRNLVDAVHELVASLGMKPGPIREREIRVNGQPYVYWRVSFLPTEKVFTLDRKLARMSRIDEPRRQQRYVTSVERVASVPVRCIEVASDSHLFLAGRSMVPTHNSTFLKQHGEKLGLDIDEKGNPTNAIVINPDEMKSLLLKAVGGDGKPLVEPIDGIRSGEMAMLVHEESSYLANLLAERALAQGKNVVFDITLGDGEKARRKYLTNERGTGASDLGYTVKAAFVDGDMPTSLHRAGLRHKQPSRETGDRGYSGRFVPYEHISAQATREDRKTSDGKDPMSQNRLEYDDLVTTGTFDSAIRFDNKTGEFNVDQEFTENEASAADLLDDDDEQTLIGQLEYILEPTRASGVQVEVDALLERLRSGEALSAEDRLALASAAEYGMEADGETPGLLALLDKVRMTKKESA